MKTHTFTNTTHQNNSIKQKIKASVSALSEYSNNKLFDKYSIIQIFKPCPLSFSLKYSPKADAPLSNLNERL